MLTTMSSEPNSATTPANSDLTAARSVTEAVEARATPPSAVIRRAVCAAVGSSSGSPCTPTPGSMATTATPRRASSRATAVPMPPPPPVTTAVRRRRAAPDTASGLPLPIRSVMVFLPPRRRFPVALARGEAVAYLATDLRAHDVVAPWPLIRGARRLARS